MQIFKTLGGGSVAVEVDVKVGCQFSVSVGLGSAVAWKLQPAKKAANINIPKMRLLRRKVCILVHILKKNSFVLILNQFAAEP